MKRKLLTGLVTALAPSVSGPAMAAGELNIFNWGNYTNPELLKKFEKTWRQSHCDRLRLQ